MSEAKMTLRDTIVPKSDQINYDDVMTAPLTVRVTGLKAGSAEQPVIVGIVDAATGAELRDFKPCKSMRRVLIAAWGDKGKEWIGKSMTLYGDSGVRFGGVEVGGIRISHVSGITEPLALKLTTTRSKRAEYIVKPLETGAR
jgi:hypothetical protein